MGTFEKYSTKWRCRFSEINFQICEIRFNKIVLTPRCQAQALLSPGLGQDQGPDQDPHLLKRILTVRDPHPEVRVAVAQSLCLEDLGLARSPGHQILGREQDLALEVHDREVGPEIVK